MLFKEMAAEAGCPCPDLVMGYLTGGAPMIGELPATGMYDMEETVPTATVQQVLEASRWSKRKLAGGMRPHKDPWG